MQKKDILSLNRDPDHIEGYVTIDYKDPDTGKVKERIEGKNHVFKDSFQTGNWWNFLWNTQEGIESFFVTDNNELIDNNFPFLKGNIIGWGRIGQGMQGLHRGEWNTWGDLSSRIANPIGVNYDSGMWYRQSYNFGPHQIPAKIGCVGLTCQYTHLTSATNIGLQTERALMPIRLRRRFWIIDEDTGSAYLSSSNGYYRIFSPTVARVYKTHAMRTDNTTLIVYDQINSALNSVVAGAGFTLSIGMDEDTGRAYIWAHHSTAANRRLYEFADDTFQELLNTYVINNVAQAPSGNNRAFIVYKRRVYHYHAGGWWRTNIFDNVSGAVRVNAQTNPCPYNNFIQTNQTLRSVVYRIGKYAFTTIWHSTTDGTRIPFYDMELDTYGGSIGNIGRFGDFVLFDTSLEGRSPHYMGLRLGDWGDVYMMKQAFCAFTVPDDAPERQPGQMVTISYQLDVHW